LAKRTINIAISFIWLAGLAACSVETYRPIPLDPELTLGEFTRRSLADPALADFARERGRTATSWPPSRWGWPDLALVAAYYHPDLAVARARQQVAQSGVAAVGQLSPKGVGLLFEHHGDTVSKTSPWSIGIDVDLPASGAGRHAARIEQSEAQLNAAEFETAEILWQLQVGILRRCIELFAAKSDTALLQEETVAQHEIESMLTKRLALGVASGTEITTARQRRLVGEEALSEAAVREEDAFAALAQAIGITTAALRKIELALEGLGDLRIVSVDSKTWRALALHENSDLHRLLADYAAAEAAVKLEVARQFPELSLKPGYLWDQGDNRWSLALGWLVPPTLGNQPAIREAEAKRQVVALQFMARQATIIAEVDAAALRYGLAREAMERAQAVEEIAIARELRSRRDYEAGAADHVDLIASHLDTLAADRALLFRRIALLQAQADLAAAVQTGPQSASPLALEHIRWRPKVLNQ
jgi:outer membrane protein TolC